MTTTTDKKAPTKLKERKIFNAEIQNIMQMIIKNIYNDKSASIRELISNASDALDKYISHYASIESDAKVQIPNLKIQLKINETDKIVEISDNGIGMTYDDVVNYIGSIASSGTKKFKQDMIEQNSKSTGEVKKEAKNLIGQFVVGFYSSFLIAEKVEMITKKVGHPAYKWSSHGDSCYDLEELAESDTGLENYLHGTVVRMHIKEGNEKYLKVAEIKDIISKHSKFINYPIYIEELKEFEEPIEIEEDLKKEEAEEVKEGEDKKEEAKEGEDKKDEEVKEEKPKTKKVTKTVNTQLNTTKPLWTQDPAEITKETYEAFYKDFTGSYDGPLAYKHVRLESIPTNFEVLLFFPKSNPVNLFSGENQKNRNIKLFSNNVFIAHLDDEIIPQWMGFVQGVISAPHLPMNISREMLQGDKTLKQIKRILFKQVMGMIETLSFNQEKFDEFYKVYSNNIKLAIKTDTSGSKNEFVDLLRFKTNLSTEPITFKKYTESMKDEQKQIYVLTALTENEAKNSPFLPMYTKNNLQVFLLDTPFDEVLLQSMDSYSGKKIQRINVDGVELPESMKETNNEEEFKAFNEKLKTLLDLDSCVLKQTGKPFLISASKYGASAAMKNLMHSQVKAENDPYAMLMGMAKNVLNIDPTDSTILALNSLLSKGDEESIAIFERNAKLLYSTAEAEASLLGLDYNKVVKHCEAVNDLVKRFLAQDEKSRLGGKVEEVE